VKKNKKNPLPLSVRVALWNLRGNPCPTSFFPSDYLRLAFVLMTEYCVLMFNLGFIESSMLVNPNSHHWLLSWNLEPGIATNPPPPTWLSKTLSHSALSTSRRLIFATRTRLIHVYPCLVEKTSRAPNIWHLSYSLFLYALVWWNVCLPWLFRNIYGGSQRNGALPSHFCKINHYAAREKRTRKGKVLASKITYRFPCTPYYSTHCIYRSWSCWFITFIAGLQAPTRYFVLQKSILCEERICTVFLRLLLSDDGMRRCKFLSLLWTVKLLLEVNSRIVTRASTTVDSDSLPTFTVASVCWPRKLP